MRISDWSSDVCSSDLQPWRCPECLQACLDQHGDGDDILCLRAGPCARKQPARRLVSLRADFHPRERHRKGGVSPGVRGSWPDLRRGCYVAARRRRRSAEPMSVLQAQMRDSYAVFCQQEKTISEHATISSILSY